MSGTYPGCMFQINQRKTQYTRILNFFDLWNFTFKFCKISEPYKAIRKASKNQIKSSLYSPYYAEACNELRGPSPRLRAWATQLRRNVATVASRWRHCADLTGPGIEPKTSRTESERFATELTAGLRKAFFFIYISRLSTPTVM